MSLNLRYFEVSYSEFQSIRDYLGLIIGYIEELNRYLVFIVENPKETVYTTVVIKDSGTEHTDFETNHKSSSILYTNMQDGIAGQWSKYRLVTKGDTRLKVAFSTDNTPSVDAFSRLRTSQAVTVFESQMEYGLQDDIFGTITSGNGSVIHLPNESTAQLQVGTDIGDKIIRQSHRYMRYNPGKSTVIFMTGVVGAKKSGVRQRIGYFDDYNGVFFEQDQNNLKVVKRSSIDGTVQHIITNQSEWNIDKLDGTGISGIILDTSKSQIFIMDLQWLGVGRIRYGFNIGGEIHYVHEFTHANVENTTYMTTANLPIRYELENIGSTSSNTTMKQICSSVVTEGGLRTEDEFGYIYTAYNTTPKPINTNEIKPLLSIRLSPTYQGKINRTTLLLESVSILSLSDQQRWSIVKNGNLTGANWIPTNSESSVEYSIAATAISGGIVLLSKYAEARAESSEIKLPFRHPFTLNAQGTQSDIITLASTSISSNSNAYGSITWREIR